MGETTDNESLGLGLLATEEADGRAAGADQGVPRPGSLIGRFIVLGTLGAGGMGLVLAAYDPSLDRKVAIKLLHPQLRAGETAERGALRLLREAQAMARITHPNVIAVYEVGSFADQVFLAMELVDGGTLEEWLRAPRPWRAVVRAFAAAGRGLAAAHALGMVHRDFKPSNVLLSADGRVLVTDFGVVGVVGGEAVAAKPSVSWSGLTHAGAVVGTPAFMAPEQRAGEAVDGRADQYSFCLALRAALTGRPAGAADAPTAPDAPAAPDAPDAGVPRFLRPLLRRGLADRPEERHPSMDALLRGIERGPLVTPRRIAAAAVLVAAAAAAVPLVRASSVRPCRGLDDRLAGVWDATVAGQVERAFRATGRPYAAATFRTVRAALDGYAAAWGRSRVDACEATAVRREQSATILDARMACLDDRRRELGATARALAAVDAAGIERAVLAAAQLTPLDGCDDVTALLRRAPPPADPAARAAVAALDERILEASADARLAHYHQAIERLDAVLAEARPLDYRPLLARALFELGAAHGSLREHAPAEKALGEAILAADGAGDDRLRARAWLERSRLAQFEGRYPDAHQANAAARATAERLGGDADLEARVIYHESLTFKDEGQLDRALPLAEECVGRVESAHLPATQLAAALSNLSNLFGRAGRFAEAESAAARVTAIDEAAYGREHPFVARDRCNLGVLQYRRRDLAASEATTRECVRVLMLFYPPDNAELARPLSNLGLTILNQGRPGEARPYLERAVAIFEKALPDSPDRGDTMSSLARALIETGTARDAVALLERAIALIDASGVRPREAADARIHLGAAHASLGDTGRARALYEDGRARAVALGDEELRASAEAGLAKLGEAARPSLSGASRR